MRAVATATFGGYDAGYDIVVTNEYASDVDSYVNGGFLIIVVTPVGDGAAITDYVGCSIFGEWWFDADDRVMQQL